VFGVDVPSNGIEWTHENLLRAARSLSEVSDGVRHTLADGEWRDRAAFGSDPLGLVVGEIHAKRVDRLTDDLKNRSNALEDHADGLVAMSRREVDTDQAVTDDVNAAGRAPR
jgi:hypothetical protein